MPMGPSRGEAHSSALSAWDVGPGYKVALLGREAGEAKALDRGLVGAGAGVLRRHRDSGHRHFLPPVRESHLGEPRGPREQMPQSPQFLDTGFPAESVL